MKELDYEFKQGDYVVCTGLSRKEIQSIVDRMVECGANLYEDSVSYSEDSNSLAWDRDNNNTNFLRVSRWSEDGHFCEVKWEDIKPKSSSKSLREMYPNGMYTDNSPEVFKRFQGLLEGDVNGRDASYYDERYAQCGLDGKSGTRPLQYCSFNYDRDCVYLTNEEFFAVELEPREEQGISIEDITQAEIQAGNLIDTTSQSIGTLVTLIKDQVEPNTPEICISSNGKTMMYGLDGYDVDVTGKSVDDIDEIYQALVVLMRV